MRVLGVCYAFCVFAGMGQASLTFEFSGSGNAGGVPTSADVIFTINSNDLVIELANTGGPGQVQDIGSELTGLAFQLSGGSPSVNDASLSGSAGGGIDCSSGTCVPVTLPASPYGWTFSGSATYALDAGGGSWKPEAIVNHNIAVADGVANAQHNPLLLGPVIYTIDFTGAAPTDVTNVVFHFGTGNVTDRGFGGPQDPSPEPSTAGLMGGGLALAALLARGRHARRLARIDQAKRSAI